MESYFFDTRRRSKIRANYRDFKSVTELQLLLARPTWGMLVETRKIAFFERLALCAAESPVHVIAVISGGGEQKSNRREIRRPHHASPCTESLCALAHIWHGDCPHY